MEIIKGWIFNFVWAALVALATVAGLVWLNGKIDLDEWLFFPTIVEFLHSHGMSVKKILFFILFLLYWLNSWHHVITRGLLAIAEFIFKIVLIVVGTILLVTAAYFGWHFLCWLANIL